MQSRQIGCYVTVTEINWRDIMEYSFKPDEVFVTAWAENLSPWSLKEPTGIKVEHKKTGIVVTCDKERSQHRNRHLAFVELEEKLKVT